MIELGSLLHQFNTERFELMRGRQVRAVTREPRASFRLLAQVRRIDPDPGIRFSGTRYHRLAPRHFSFECRKSWFESNKSCGWRVAQLEFGIVCLFFGQIVPL